MPLNKSYRRRRRTFRKRRLMGGIATRPRRPRPMTVGKVKRIISAELKFKVINHNDNVVNTANPAVILLSNIAQGNDNDERDGNRITPVNTHGHVSVFGETAGGGDDTTPIRVTIFRWNEDAGATPPTPALLMQDVAQLGGPYNIDNKGMFKVIYSRFFVLVNDQTNPMFKKTLRYYVKLSGKMLYDGAGAANNLKKFHLYMIIQATSADANAPTYTLNNTLRFTDS